jgi:hypothetical protein
LPPSSRASVGRRRSKGSGCCSLLGEPWDHDALAAALEDRYGPEIGAHYRASVEALFDRLTAQPSGAVL